MKNSHLNYDLKELFDKKKVYGLYRFTIEESKIAN